MKKGSTAAATSKRNLDQKLTIGLDLGDRSGWYCVLDETGEVIQEQKLAGDNRRWHERSPLYSQIIDEPARVQLAVSIPYISGTLPRPEIARLVGPSISGVPNSRDPKAKTRTFRSGLFIFCSETVHKLRDGE